MNDLNIYQYESALRICVMFGSALKKKREDNTVYINPDGKFNLEINEERNVNLETLQTIKGMSYEASLLVIEIARIYPTAKYISWAWGENGVPILHFNEVTKREHTYTSEGEKILPILHEEYKGKWKNSLIKLDDYRPDDKKRYEESTVDQSRGRIT